MTMLEGPGESLNINKSRWLGYLAASAAVSIAGTSTAEADFTNVVLGADGFVDVNSEKTFSLGGVELRFEQNAIVSTSSGSTFLNAESLTASFLGNGTFTGNATGQLGNRVALRNLAVGEFVSSQNFSTFYQGDPDQAPLDLGAGALLVRGSGDSFGFGLNQEVGHIGFRFDNGDGFQYGWARIRFGDADPATPFYVEQYVFADAGQSVKVGQIPEPGGLGLLALGAAGLLASRRRSHEER